MERKKDKKWERKKDKKYERKKKKRKEKPYLNGDSLIVLVHCLGHIDFEGSVGLAFGARSRLHLG